MCALGPQARTDPFGLHQYGSTLVAPQKLFKPMSLLEICMHAILKHLSKYATIMLPDELTLKLTVPNGSCTLFLFVGTFNQEKKINRSTTSKVFASTPTCIRSNELSKCERSIGKYLTI
jgi:hypothetical protein